MDVVTSEQSSWTEEKCTERIRNHDVVHNNYDAVHECPGGNSLVKDTPPQPSVNVGMDLDQTEAKVHAIMNEPQKNETSRCYKRKNHSMKINDSDLDCHQGSSSMKPTTGRGLCIDSSVANCRMAGSGMPQSNSESKKRRKKQKEKHNALESNGKDYDRPEGTSLLNVTLPETDPSLQLPVKSCSKLEVKNKHVSLDQKNLKTYRRRETVKTTCRRIGKSSASFENSLESIKDGMGDPLSHCSDKAPTAGLLEKKLDVALLREHATSAQVVDDMSMEEAYFNCTDGEPASRDCKETTEMKTIEKNSGEPSFVNDVSVPDVLKANLEQKNGGKHHKIQITGQDMSCVNEDFDEPASYGEEKTANNISGCGPSCKHLKQVDVEIETEIKGSASSNIGVVKNDACLDVINKEGNLSQMSNSSKKKLLILDVNGLLVDIVPYVPNGYKADIILSKKAVFKRPFCDNFLQFCFERFVVGVWSSRIKRNMDRLIDFLMGDSEHKLVFCWDQSQCTSTGFNTIENKEKPLVLKELRKLWEKLEPNLPWERGEYNEANTLLLDDSPYKALVNPVNTAIFPHTYRYSDVKDMSLGPGGDLRVYLEGLAMAENVQKYVEQNPFGQHAITESNPSWGFYRKIMDTIANPPQDNASPRL